MADTPTPPVIRRFTIVTEKTPAVPVPLDFMNAMRVWLTWIKNSMIEAETEAPGAVGPEAITELERIDQVWLNIVQTSSLIYFRRIVPIPDDAEPAPEGDGPIGPPINERGC